jgi:excisionase family DNA binding protein
VSGRPLSLAVPPELVDVIAEHVGEIVAERVIERLGTATGSPWMTVAEAAEYLRWPRERLYKLTAAGAIPHRKHDGRLLFSRDELAEWIDGYREGPSPLRPARAHRKAA